MNKYMNRHQGLIMAVAALALLFFSSGVQAAIQGITAQTFNLRAKAGYISTADGSSLFFWGYANEDGAGLEQYPGPTMIVTAGLPVTVNLTNNLREPTSIVFPGQTVTASGGIPGLLTKEAPPDQLTTVTYSFTPTQPGTYTYYSGTHTDLQVEMGLVGALIVQPAVQDLAGCSQTMSAYGDCSSAYDHEYLFLLSEMDPVIHNQVEFGQINQVDTAAFWPVLWFINGRNGPDTLGMNCDATLPNQPYNIIPRITPGQRLLLRLIGGGRDLHPFHTHGNNYDLIARDGNLLKSPGGVPKTVFGGVVPDLAVSDFTQTVTPGATYDAVFTWTGKDLGWDIYGAIDPLCTDADNNGFDDTTGALCHDATCTDVTPADGYDDATFEWCADHSSPFPVTLPGTDVTTPGGNYSGSPFLGAAGFLPPGEGGNNPNSGYFYMWHSHNEREIVNFDIFPGGMLTMLIVEPPGTTILPMGGVCP